MEKIGSLFGSTAGRHAVVIVVYARRPESLASLPEVIAAVISCAAAKPKATDTKANSFDMFVSVGYRAMFKATASFDGYVVEGDALRVDRSDGSIDCWSCASCDCVG